MYKHDKQIRLVCLETPVLSRHFEVPMKIFLVYLILRGTVTSRNGFWVDQNIFVSSSDVVWLAMAGKYATQETVVARDLSDEASVIGLYHVNG